MRLFLASSRDGVFDTCVIHAIWWSIQITRCGGAFLSHACTRDASCSLAGLMPSDIVCSSSSRTVCHGFYLLKSKMFLHLTTRALRRGTQTLLSRPNETPHHAPPPSGGRRAGPLVQDDGIHGKGQNQGEGIAGAGARSGACRAVRGGPSAGDRSDAARNRGLTPITGLKSVGFARPCIAFKFWSQSMLHRYSIVCGLYLVVLIPSRLRWP